MVGEVNVITFMFEKNDHINFTLEQKKYGPQRRNFVESTDTTGGGLSRYDVSPVVESLINAYAQSHISSYEKYKNISFHDFKITTIDESPDCENYVISAGVNHSPYDWTGPPFTDMQYKNRKSLFEDLNPKYLSDLQNNKALLLLDQTHEGYTHRNLFSWFYSELSKYKISPAQIIYTSGDLNGIKQHDDFADSNNIPPDNRMFVQPYAAFQWMIYSIQHQLKVNEFHTYTETIDNLIQYKKDNIDKIRPYNCLQKRSRPHRCWVWKKLYDMDLVRHGIVSSNLPDSRHTFAFEGVPSLEQEEFVRVCKDLPLIHGYDKVKENDNFVDQCGGHFISKLNREIMADSFVSVVSEAMFGDDSGQGQCFLSEKTFKPISEFHPFIIIGDKGSLSHIRSMGYKTFDKWWDEGYDELPTWQRLDAIMKIVKNLSEMNNTQLMEMYLDMQDVLTYNRDKFIENCDKMYAPQAVNIVEHIRSKF